MIVNFWIIQHERNSGDIEMQATKRMFPDFGERVLVKVKIPDVPDEEIPGLGGTQGDIYISTGIRFQADLDEEVPTWIVWLYPEITVKDGDILSWKHLPDDF